MYTVYTSKHAQYSKTRKDSSARVHFVIPQIIWIGSYEYVLCGCVLSLTSGVYKMDLGYTSAYKETQVQLDQSFWGISTDVVGAFLESLHIWSSYKHLPHSSKNNNEIKMYELIISN